METKTKMTYRDSRMWQKSILLMDAFYQEIPAFDYFTEVWDSMRQSAHTIPSQIAKGFECHETQAYKHCLGGALGSCIELEILLKARAQLSCLTEDRSEYLVAKIRELSRIIESVL